MRRHTIFYRAFAATFGLLPLGQAIAVEQAGSYATGTSCYCTGVMPPDLAHKEFPTPIGAQTVTQICAQVGPGPGPSPFGGRDEPIAYPGVQCGNGPFVDGGDRFDFDCAASGPADVDGCRAVGPRWDLATAYTGEDGDDPIRIGPLTENGSDARMKAAERTAPLQTASPSRDGRLQQVPSESREIVEIAGERWRQAPPGTSEHGAAGSRIILDGDVWLKADDPTFALQRELEKYQARIASADKHSDTSPSIVSAASLDALSDAPPDASDNASLERRSELVVQTRSRAADWHEIRTLRIEDLSPSAPRLAAALAEVADEAQAPIERVSDDELAADAVAEQSNNPSEEQAAPVSALRLPMNARGSSSEFGYLQAMPVSYDIGGVGMVLEASAELRDRFHVVSRIGLADKYQEVSLGAGLHYTPPTADRLTLLVTAGMEYGLFPLVGEETGLEVDDASSGFFLHAATRMVLNARFELEGGVGYSSFHEGDPNAFGGAYFHINSSVDLLSRFEVGDQNAYGIGVRVYY